MRKVVSRSAACFAMMMLSQVSFAQDAPKKTAQKIAKWFPKYDFSPAVFQNPPLEFAPFARWWWPGNNVDSTELKREINLFADNDFGGVEVQPLNLFVPGTKEARAKAVTWDTPDYYANLIAVMQEARKRGLIVDMTDGSGWPPGGSFLSTDDGFISLESASMDLPANGNNVFALPTITNNSDNPSRLVTVLAAKTLPKKAGDKTSTIPLDPSSTIVVTQYVKNDSLHWKAPAGNWRIIAFWSKPATQKTMTASPTQGPVMNHLDSTKVLKSYKHLFGERTGLAPYFGNPMRAVFNDSYEFAVDRHYAYGFIDYFKKHRGYDITPWLPAETQRGYNYVTYMRPKTDPDFVFSDQDWRLKYDYDLTVSELLGEQFIKASRDWLEPQGLLHRTQAYGLNMDMIAEAGLASIPETESMLGPEANLKIMTSGGHLYNRPIETSESVVFQGRAYTTTPQKIKIAVDKLFAAGVNQVIYHGVPYHYTPAELGPEGWYPFSSTMVPGMNFSSNLGEGNIFWKDQKDVNEYINRTQYALRSGKSHADVLIYFPFMDVDNMPANPEEILANGYLPGIEGPLTTGKSAGNPAKEAWARRVYPLINQLAANGITWDWVNDLSIQDARLTTGKQINIRGNIYQALVLADDTIIQLKTAQKIKYLASKGMNLIATDNLPRMQPSFLNWQENDKKTEIAIASALKYPAGKYLKNDKDLAKWIKDLHQPVSFNGEYHFTREVQRDMSDGSRVEFIWNKSDEWQTISLSLDKKYKSSYWMDADQGRINQNGSSTVTYRMPPYGSIILFATTTTPLSWQDWQSFLVGNDQYKIIASIDKWNLSADSVDIKNSALFDWRTNDRLKFSSAAGVYSSSFQWNDTTVYINNRYYVDLGKVYFTAEVYVNGKLAGKRVFAPYMIDITNLVIPGENQIVVRVTTGQLNGYIGKAKQGDAHYKQFKGKEDQVMAAGLLGPVVIRKEYPQ
jgi:hypothetical protein